MQATFWKVFSVSALGAILVLGFSAVQALGSLKTVTVKGDPRRELKSGALSAMTRVPHSATVFLNGGESSVTGTVQQDSGRFLTIKAVRHPGHTNTTAIIPWDSVLYIEFAPTYSSLDEVH